MKPRFIQFHSLVSYAASLLNRDDVGLAKRMPFGGAIRTRISSQCLKRHWRTYEGTNSLKSLQLPESIRSRHTFEKLILEPLVEEGVERDKAIACVKALQAVITGSDEKDKKKKGEDSEKGSSFAGAKQILVFGMPEIKYLKDVARKACADVSEPKGFLDYFKKSKDLKENLRGLYCASGLDAALFGRMVTSDYLARCDAAVHVAHAFTVHEAMAEPDYFTAVDDLTEQSEELGAGHINTTELTSGLYYLYVVVDVPQLISNITGKKFDSTIPIPREELELAGMVADSLLHTIATVSPGAKKGSTAPYSYASLVLAEIGEAQPRSFANAFLDPVKPPQLLEKTYAALARHVGDIDKMYADPTLIPKRFVAATGPVDALRPYLLGEGQSPLTLSDIGRCIKTEMLEWANV